MNKMNFLIRSWSCWTWLKPAGRIGWIVPGLLLANSSVGCLAQQSGDLVLPSASLGSGITVYQAPHSIQNSADFIVSSAASVTFTAGNSIGLEPGFHAIAGSASVTFHASINPNAQSAPISITSQPPPASMPTAEYIYLGGKMIAVQH